MKGSSRKSAPLLLLPCLPLLLGSPAPLEAQRTTLAGVVRNASTGVVVEAATVELDGGDHATRTDGDGRFYISGLDAGRYELSITHLDRKSGEITITVPAVTVVEMEFDLFLEPIPVKEIRVEVARAPLPLGRMAGFYERLDHGPGEFLTRKELEGISSRQLLDALRRVSGVRVRHCTRGGVTAGTECLPIRIRRCAPTHLWIDGFRVEATRINDLVQFNTEDIEGVEIYSASNVPARFHPGRFSGCTLVIWTRRSSG